MNRRHLPTDKLSTKQGRDLFCGADDSRTYYRSTVCALNRDIYSNRYYLSTDKLSTKQGQVLFCGADIRYRHGVCPE